MLRLPLTNITPPSARSGFTSANNACTTSTNPQPSHTPPSDTQTPPSLPWRCRGLRLPPRSGYWGVGGRDNAREPRPRRTTASGLCRRPIRVFLETNSYKVVTKHIAIKNP
eukprot:151352-Prorocentrum_minimum.AAC.5